MKIGNREFEKIPKFFILRAEDWQGLYIDGELVHEDHSVDAETLADYAGLDFDTVYEDGLDLAYRNGFPQKLSDLPQWIEEDQNGV